MPRGGAGKGQGRKPSVPPEGAKLIREDYEQRARAARREQWEANIKRDLEKRGGVIWEEGDEPNPADLGAHFSGGDPKAPVTAKEWKFRQKYNPKIAEYGLN